MKSFLEFINEAKEDVLRLDPNSGEDRSYLIDAAEDIKLKIKTERDPKGYIVFDTPYDSAQAANLKSHAIKKHKAKFKVVDPNK